ncbi:MAG: M23 family metallopeptidase [Alphaproteobacteria bacterium]
MPRHRFASALRLVGLCAVFGLAACASRQDPAPVSNFGLTNTSGAGVHIVREGDSVWEVAKRYQVSNRDIIDANRLTPPYYLDIGQRLKIPAPEMYRVKSGDSLYVISRTFNVDVTELARQNRIGPPYTIFEGQSLRLPRAASSRPRPRVRPEPVLAETDVPPRKPAHETPPRRPAANRSYPGEYTPRPRPVHTPEPAGVARSDAPVPPRRPDGVTPPRVPSMPSSAMPVPPVAPVSAGIGWAKLPLPARKPGWRQAASEAPRSVPNPNPAPPRAATTRTASSTPRSGPTKVVMSDPPPRSRGRFLWPVEGSIISRYGTKPDGSHNDGVNIAAARGEYVRSAEAGVVAYSGNELRGYGNLVLIRHSDGWITAYAHLDRILARPGDTVRRGEIVGTVGTSGGVTEPQLHFELRKGKRALDPMPRMSTPGS